MNIPASETLVGLYQIAHGSDHQHDWVRFYQHVAGVLLVIPLDSSETEAIRPRLVDYNGMTAVEAFTSMEGFAESLDTPTEYAEMDGAQLATALDGREVPAILRAINQTDILLVPAALSWISSTYQAVVDRTDRGEGVKVTSPELPPLEVIEMLGKTIGSLGDDCPEAWLVSMSTEDDGDELVLVLGLSDGVRAMEGELADAVTRAIQAVTNKRFAVACPTRGSALMATARACGVGIGGATT